MLIVETIIEILPVFKRDLCDSSVVNHFWIDLLAELPVASGVVATGFCWLFAWTG